MKTLEINSLSDLDEVADEILSSLGERSVVLFRGEMGAGKTTLISRIAARMGVEDSVTSPTFALVNQYEGRGGRRIYHFDFYRIEDLDEAIELGIEDYFDSGAVCLIEWPERIAAALPEDTVTVKITVNDDDSRTLTISE